MSIVSNEISAATVFSPPNIFVTPPFDNLRPPLSFILRIVVVDDFVIYLNYFFDG